MNMRRVTSLTMLLAFVLMALTGIVLYIVPEGRVAYWSDWRLLGLSKTRWGDLHVTMGLLMLLSGSLHIWFNWRPIVNYLKNRSRELRVFTREFNGAFLVTVAILLLTGFGLPPLSWVLAASESIKGHAAETYGEPPYGHAERSSLKVLARRMGHDLERSLAKLKAAGVAVNGPEDRILEIARRNGMSPQEVYAVIHIETSSEGAARPGRGTGPGPDRAVDRRERVRGKAEHP